MTEQTPAGVVSPPDGPEPRAEELRDRLAAFLRHHLGVPEVVVDPPEQIQGGASRLSYRVRYRAGDDPVVHAVLRMVPESGGFTTEGAEYEAVVIEALAGSGVPVPEILCRSEDPAWLGAPFMLMVEVRNCSSDAALLFEPRFAEVREQIGRTFWEALGRLAALDPVRLGLAEAAGLPDADQAWRLELDFVNECLAAGGAQNHPLGRYLLLWLEENPPPPSGKVAIVHGDFRPGNFLFDESGAVRAVLDWERWRLGDPVIDLAYSLRPTWRSKDGETLIPEADAIAAWERTSGLTLDPRARAWFEVADRAAALGTLAQMQAQYIADGGHENTIYFFVLRSLSASWPRLRELVGLPEPTIAPRVAPETQPSKDGGEGLGAYVALLGERIGRDIAPAMPTPHARANTALDTRILRVVADRLENGVDILASDNTEVAAVLEAALATAPEAAREAGADLVLRQAPASLRTSALQRRNDELWAVCVRLLDRVHRGATSEDREVRARIEQALSNHYERLVLPLATFTTP
ncbi:phosphotransferase family protein [Amycolatopsis thermoflava]|uniref:phosphotransferase family protein n=1 Tax=Amycolatopsis thermoflava TaxID=84480 RepID=UPI00380F6765